jgi:hypothetical protein
MSEFTWKTSTVFVAIGGQTKIYRTVDEMPFAVRQRLSEKVKSWNSATIMIADQRGREVLVRALCDDGSGRGTRHSSSVAARGLIAETEAAASLRGRSAHLYRAALRIGGREVGVLVAVTFALLLVLFGR